MINTFCWKKYFKIIRYFRDDREEVNKLAQEIQQKLRYSEQEVIDYVCCFSVTFSILLLRFSFVLVLWLPICL